MVQGQQRKMKSNAASRQNEPAPVLSWSGQIDSSIVVSFVFLYSLLDKAGLLVHFS